MAYASASDVYALCKGLVGSSGSAFSASTQPTDTQVITWLSSGCAVLETQLAAWGYSVPVSESSAAYDWLKDLNTLFAAARAELTRATATIQPGERTRGQVFDKMFKDGLKELGERNLTGAGITRDTSAGGTLYVGGISRATKDTYVADTDRVQPRFYRGQHDFSGTLRSRDYDSDDDD